MRIVAFKNKKIFIEDTVNFILKNLKKNANIALSGGTTPQPIYKALHKKLKPIFGKNSNPEFFQVDERYVPKNHKDSNYKLINESLINPKRPSLFHHFDTSLPIKKSLAKYSAQLPKSGFDLCILGIGPDGHTASLFPNSPALNSKAKVAHTTTEEFARAHGASAQQAKHVALPLLSAASLQKSHRLTLTFPTILKSKKILILLKGKDKAPILEKLKTYSKKSQNPSDLKNFPALKLLKHHDLTIHFSIK